MQFQIITSDASGRTHTYIFEADHLDDLNESLPYWAFTQHLMVESVEPLEVVACNY